ncbi:hypothetical protein LY56_01168 [Roseinatronobacter thiooxidans]|uniref:Uncharacterized protein n=1 Tax=Roseinatronobacter thiooxidans TaxID=121821 RepID=A0A2W7QQN9_9RHOB|nr:hypothetical protein LY56_01168 [Roseinatronobacter thiooxidans]
MRRGSVSPQAVQVG